MKKCTYCGRENEDAAAFCQECGELEFQDAKSRFSTLSRAALLAQPWPEEWEAWLAGNFAHYSLLDDTERERLRDDARIITAEKVWEGCKGLEVTPIMKITIAAQTALLLLGLKHDYFSRVYSIAVFPSDFALPAEPGEQRGALISGQAVNHGSVFLAWDRVLMEGRDPSGGNNLVIHEFAHQLDFLDGYTNGAPPLRDGDLTRRWKAVMTTAYDRLCREEGDGRKTFLGAYAATNPTEFFSVISEKFFLLPSDLRHFHPEVYEVLAEYYGMSPIRWFAGRSSNGTMPVEKNAGAVPTAGRSNSPRPQQAGFTDCDCPCCGRAISFPEADVGKLKQCPTCLEGMVVPEPGTAAEQIAYPIQTSRLQLRTLQKRDWKDLFTLMSDKDSLRHSFWEPMSDEQVEDWLKQEKRVPFPTMDQCIYFGIEHLESGQLIGIFAYWFLNDGLDLAEFTVLIHPDWRRQGCGMEAVRGFFGHAFRGLNVRRIVAHCDRRNVAARGLLLKSGMRQEEEHIQDEWLKGEWISTYGFALLRDEFNVAAPPRLGAK